MLLKKWIDETEKGGWKKEFHDNSVMTVRQWLMIHLMMIVPVVNVVMMLRWAFADKELTNANQVNWARASVIVLAASLASVALIGAILFFAWYIHNH